MKSLRCHAQTLKLILLLLALSTRCCRSKRRVPVPAWRCPPFDVWHMWSSRPEGLSLRCCFALGLAFVVRPFAAGWRRCRCLFSALRFEAPSFHEKSPLHVIPCYRALPSGMELWNSHLCCHSHLDKFNIKFFKNSLPSTFSLNDFKDIS